MLRPEAVQTYLAKLDAPQRARLDEQAAVHKGADLESMAAALGIPVVELPTLIGNSAALGLREYGQGGNAAASYGAAALRRTLNRFQFADLADDGPAQVAKLAGNGAMTTDFPGLAHPQADVAAVRSELAGIAAAGGKTVLDKLQNHPRLDAEQKTRLLNVLAEVHQSFMAKASALEDKPGSTNYQVVNWNHTRAEIDFVMEASRLNGLDARQTEDALLASMFSDCVKSPDNFITHNLDGAKAAAEVLGRHLDPTSKNDVARIEGICAAVEEHQIGPPGFMGNIIVKGMLTGTLMSELKKASPEAIAGVEDKIGNPLLMGPEARATCAEQIATNALIVQGKPVTLSADEKTVAQLALQSADTRDSAAAKIATPFDSAVKVAADRSEVGFTDAEKALLSKIGVDRWAVPDPDSAHNAASRAVIDGDSLVNYSTPEGFAKIVAIRGPDTSPFFQDPRIETSIQSARDSYADAYVVMSDRGQKLAGAQLTRTETALGEMANQIDAWIDTENDVPRNKDGSVPFWNADLRYPSEDKPLTALEQKQFDFAKKIRAKAIALLQTAHGEGVS